MVLAAAAQFAGEAQRRARERRLDLAADHGLRGRDEAFALHRLLDRQHGRKRFVGDVDELGRRARLVERRRRDRRHRLALVLDHPGRQGGLVAADGRDVVLARNVGGGHRRDDAGRGQRARQVDVADAGMRMRAEHQRRFQRLRHGRHIVEVARRAGDMPDRAVMAYRGMHRAAAACNELVHSASTRMGAASEVSSWNRRNRPPAARMR
jgi:hypothetical protein